MAAQLSPFDQLNVPVPCRASWDAMTGNNQVRFCSHCRQRVYNLSGMTRSAAELLLRTHEVNICARFYQRPDGTILTRDCVKGFRAIRRWLALGLGGVATILFFLLVQCAGGRGASAGWQNAEPFRTIFGWFAIQQTQGKICPPPGSQPGGGQGL